MRKILLSTITLACSVAAVSALAQAPTPAQQQAIRSSCVSDYRANCSSVPTGGMDALICLEQHEAKLSPACKSAVEAVDHGSGSSASASSSAGTPAAGGTEKATENAAKTTEAPKTEAAAPAATASRTPASGKPAMSLRQEMRLAARACQHDYRVLCPNLPVGQGNILFCLKVHEQRLSPPCRTALIEAGEVLQ
ncbi:hypothetical protein [Hoeflea poritis]|uniref:Cysteine rich repeat protein n=1 Tax=Hoeflea poritis TaxID=2993659 RepID=A0ABT4VHG3_9HYPH|nr:hypothetical protein [Hoeflea poritis]MDA4844156.1 hypothetical protein [Hoeflea poritis]